MESDEELYRRWADSDDKKAGNELFQRYIHSLNQFIESKVQSTDDANELVSTTFLNCVRSKGKFEGRSSFRTYLFGIGYNAIRDYVKKKVRGPAFSPYTTRVADLDPTPSTLLRERETDQLVLDAFRALPIENHALGELKYYEDMTRQEIADTLQIPPGTVASRLRKTAALLRVEFERLESSPRRSESVRKELHDLGREICEVLEEDDEHSPVSGDDEDG